MKWITLLILSAMAFGQNIHPSAINGIVYANATQGIQAAINSLPSGGGSVVIPCGTFTGPTSIPSNTTLTSGCERPSSLSYATLWGTNPGGVFRATGGTVLTYSSNLNFTQVQNISISNLVMDFASGGFGVNITSSSLLKFSNVLIDRCGSTTQPCLNMTTTGALATNNNLLNSFDHLKINASPPSGTVTGVVLNGSIANSNFVTQNEFTDLRVGGALSVGIDFQTNCDTNWFYGVTINSSSAGAMGMQFNNATPASDVDANSIHVYGYTCSAGCASPFIRFGQSSGNYITGFGNGVAPTVVGGNPAFLVFWSGATNGSVPSTYSNALNKLDLTTILQANLTGAALFQEGVPGTAPGSAAPLFDVCQGSNTSHSLQCSWNNGTFYTISQTIGVGSVTTAGTAVNTGTCQAQTGITVTGAVTTDNVTANIGAVLPATWQTGIQLSAHVTAGNTVTVYLCNPTAGNITPAATQVNVRIVR